MLNRYTTPVSITTTLLIACALTVGIARSEQPAWSKTKTPAAAKHAPEPAEAVAPQPSAPKTQTIVLGDRLATVHLPMEYVFVDAQRAAEFLKKQGGSEEGVLGIIAPADETQDYFVLCRFEDVGYVNDDDAEKLNADDILKSYKEGTEEQNQERKDMNLPPIYVGGWAEKPHYEKASHQMVWAIEVKDEDSASAPVSTVNYNTRILGRRGVLSMNLVTDPSQLPENKLKVAALLDATKFNKGQTYADYIPGKDKSAGYGLAGLILGGGALAAAAKFGIFGALWKWALGLVLVLKKFIILAVVGVGALLSKLFGKKKNDQSGPGLPS